MRVLLITLLLRTELGPVNQVNHTSHVAGVFPTNRPKSVRNRRVVELFGCVLCYLNFSSVWVYLS